MNGSAIDYEQLKIASYKHWEVFLHENQCYLGRVFVQLKDVTQESEGIDDFIALEGDLREEFFSVSRKIKNALSMLFHPDKMNYAALSNVSPKIHVHIVPRYKDRREFSGITFEDTRWGKNYAPYDRSFKIEENVLFQIRDALKNFF